MNPTPPTIDAQERREAVARLIDPSRWDMHLWAKDNSPTPFDVSDLLAKADAILALLAASSGERGAKYAAVVMHELSEAQKEIAMLRDIVVTYGDKLRMGTVHRMDWQQAIDRAFERDPA